MVDRTADGESPEWQSDMIDLSDISLSDLLLPPADDSPLARSLRRAADELTAPGDPIAGFNSAL